MMKAEVLGMESSDKIQQREEREEIKASLLDFIKRWPTYYLPYNNLAILFWESGDYENAVKYFDTALRISQFDRSVVMSYGQMLIKL